MYDRKKTEEYILSTLSKVDKSKVNTEFYTKYFKSLSDKEFKEMFINLRDNDRLLPIIYNEDTKITIKNNMNIAKSLFNYNFFQHIIVSGQDGMPDYKTPVPYLVLPEPVRRAVQTLAKKRSIPKNSKKIDLLTGQVTGESKASKITGPEIQLMLSQKMTNTAIELMKDRGGDLGTGAAMNNILLTKGEVSDAELAPYSTGVVSVKTLKSYFSAMHLRSTL